MGIIDWRAEYSVGIPSIDRQHQILISYINELAKALTTGHGELILERILDGLFRYTNAHFLYEEMLFAVHGYAESEEHKAAHGRLYARVSDYKVRLDAGDRHLGPMLLAFLKDWLHHHILEDDMAYAEFLVSRGVR